MYYDTTESPLGVILVAMDDQGLRLVNFQHGKQPCRIESNWIHDPERLADVTRELGEYFAGTRRNFSIPLTFRGTQFQNIVWRELTRIPYGQTISYAELARRIDRPGCARAVGVANGKNPLAIIVPCHRVIGTNGQLTGYADGLDIKGKLLTLEGIQNFAACGKPMKI